MGNAFGPFVLDDERTVLYPGAETIPLGRRGFALLQVLLAHDGGPVSKEQLLAEVWPGLIVEDVNLSVQVAHLRKALGRTPDGQDWVVTVPRYGYRLLAADAAGQRASPVPMLTVLPFHNLTGDGSQQYLVDELTSALSRFRGCRRRRCHWRRRCCGTSASSAPVTSGGKCTGWTGTTVPTQTAMNLSAPVARTLRSRPAIHAAEPAGDIVGRMTIAGRCRPGPAGLSAARLDCPSATAGEARRAAPAIGRRGSAGQSLGSAARSPISGSTASAAGVPIRCG